MAFSILSNTIPTSHGPFTQTQQTQQTQQSQQSQTNQCYPNNQCLQSNMCIHFNQCNQCYQCTQIPAQYVLPTYFIRYPFEYDTGLNDNYIAQKQMTKYLHYRILDKYLYEDLLPLLKYLKVEGNVVTPVKSINEANQNDASRDSAEIIQLKADYIEQNILTIEKMRSLLAKMVVELGYKWYNLSNNEPVVVEVVGKFLKRHFKKMFEQNTVAL
jgi:hypothetical protein